MACSTTPEDPVTLAEKGRVVTPESVAVVGPLIVPGQELATGDASKSGSDVATYSPAPLPTQLPAHLPEEPDKPAPEKSAPPSQVGQPAKTLTAPVATPAPLQQKPSQTPSPKPAVVSILSAEPKIAAQSFGSLEGTITLVGDESGDLNPKNVIVLMEPLTQSMSLSARQATTHYIDMKDKTYLPRHLTISRNDRVSFINKDRIKHNVFSSTGKNAFDLGTYGAGLQREVSLNATGVVKVYCNIHPEMATFIGVSESGLTALADERGYFTIDNIKPGRYSVTYWHIRGETTATVTIDAGAKAKVAIKINTDNPSSLEHANKFGKKYNKNAAIFDDEFY